MRMSLHTDYALRMLIYLAVREPRPCTVNDVAESYGISRNHLLKVALNLKNMGIISTARGRSGGIRLAVAPGKVTVGTVVRELGQGFPVVECMKAEGDGCALSPACRLKGVVREAIGAYLSVFDKYTLADLVANREELANVLEAYRLVGSSADRAA
jgi:Rrf2 family nitric oxide-sensitive transcriptional repressor